MKLEEKLNLIKTLCGLQSWLEGYDFGNNCKQNQLSIKIKVLAYVYNCPQSPYFLTKNIGIAKTNLNLLCNDLIKEELITKSKEEFDKRVVLYSITKKGKIFLESELEKFGVAFDNMNENKLNDLQNKIKDILSILN